MSDLNRWRQQMWREHEEGSTEFREDQEPAAICVMCSERFSVPDEDYCSGCLIHADDEGDRACPACGSTLNWDGSCGCDLPPAGDIYWAKRR
jgi:predicted amidophosphoribosyltransferase